MILKSKNMQNKEITNQNLTKSFRVFMASVTWAGPTEPIFLTSLSRDMDLK